MTLFLVEKFHGWVARCCRWWAAAAGTFRGRTRRPCGRTGDLVLTPSESTVGVSRSRHTTRRPRRRWWQWSLWRRRGLSWCCRCRRDRGQCGRWSSAGTAVHWVERTRRRRRCGRRPCGEHVSEHRRGTDSRQPGSARPTPARSTTYSRTETGSSEPRSRYRSRAAPQHASWTAAVCRRTVPRRTRPDRTPSRKQTAPRARPSPTARTASVGRSSWRRRAGTTPDDELVERRWARFRRFRRRRWSAVECWRLWLDASTTGRRDAE